jgi:hypothetical protein
MIGMESLLSGMIGKKLDINAGSGSLFSGELRSVGDGIATLLNDDDRVLYIAISSIKAFSESNGAHSRPGFIV